MFPHGFFGSRADLLFDLVISSLVVIVPVLSYSRGAAKSGRYALHRTIQILLTVVLTLVLVVFEWNLKANGGIFELTRQSRFAGTLALDIAVYSHLFFAFSSAGIWVAVLFFALFRFPVPPLPGKFTRSHRFWGRVALADILLTGTSALVLYLIGFVF